jgi:hypothetical protein
LIQKHPLKKDRFHQNAFGRTRKYGFNRAKVLFDFFAGEHYIYRQSKSNAMMNLRKFFRPNPCLLVLAKAEKELVESFLAHKTEYEHWLHLNPQPKIVFRFYFPSAVDFYYDGARLFTAYFKKGEFNEPVLHEMKMSKENHASIRSANWKPFAEVMLQFLQTLEETNKSTYLKETKSLQEYLSICNAPASRNQSEPIVVPTA